MPMHFEVINGVSPASESKHTDLQQEINKLVQDDDLDKIESSETRRHFPIFCRLVKSEDQ